MNISRKQSSQSYNNAQQIEQETNEKKTFNQDIFRIDYANKSQIIYQEGPNLDDDVKVKNYLCYQQDSKLHKVTEILYEDKIIRISDVFDISINPDKIKHKQEIENYNVDFNHQEKSRNGEKVRIFAKQQKNGVVQKKDKKNIVKNIIKIFVSWLERKKNSQNPSNALKNLQIILKKENFNNRLIKKIVGNEEINKEFLEFLSEAAEDQIQNSRIQDKQSHYEAINLYISLIHKTDQPIGSIQALNSQKDHNLISNSQNPNKNSQDQLSIVNHYDIKFQEE